MVDVLTSIYYCCCQKEDKRKDFYVFVHCIDVVLFVFGPFLHSEFGGEKINETLTRLTRST